MRDKQLEDTIVFAGYHENVNDFLPELDIAVQASLSENLGGTIEGLLMECPDGRDASWRNAGRGAGW